MIVDETFVLILLRCAGFISRAPGFSHQGIPHVLRAVFALLLAFVLAHGRSTQHLDAAALVIAAVFEFALGASIGFASSILYDGASAGGAMLDDYVGIRGSVPSATSVAGVGFGRLWSTTFTAAFFVFGGYAFVFGALADSLATLGPGAIAGKVDFERLAFTIPELVMKAALVVAGPAMAIAFTVQVAVGVLGRVVPKLSSVQITSALVFGVALIVTLIAVPIMAPRGAHPWIAPVPLER